jgi:hypothetical protein
MIESSDAKGLASTSDGSLAFPHPRHQRIWLLVWSFGAEPFQQSNAVRDHWNATRLAVFCSHARSAPDDDITALEITIRPSHMRSLAFDA